MTWYIPAAFAKQQLEQTVRRAGVEIDHFLAMVGNLTTERLYTGSDNERIIFELLLRISFERNNFGMAVADQLDLIVLLLKVVEGREDPTWLYRAVRARNLARWLTEHRNPRSMFETHQRNPRK
jgi:hypothetical protein